MDKQTKLFNVPVSVKIELGKTLFIRATTKEEAVAEVQKRLDAANAEGLDSTKHDPDGLTEITIQLALDEMCLNLGENEWQPGIYGPFQEVTIDPYNQVSEVKEGTVSMES